MKTWNDYKTYVKESDAEGRKDMEEVENLSVIIGALIRQRNALGISRRELADTCGIPHEWGARGFEMPRTLFYYPTDMVIADFPREAL